MAQDTQNLPHGGFKKSGSGRFNGYVKLLIASCVSFGLTPMLNQCDRSIEGLREFSQVFSRLPTPDFDRLKDTKLTDALYILATFTDKGDHIQSDLGLV